VAPAAPSHYQQLGVSADADLATLRQAYRRTALECHPDRANGDAGRMAAVNAAWAVLSDPARRAAYDRTARDPSH
jgi:molecular chaperone DnaJ